MLYEGHIQFKLYFYVATCGGGGVHRRCAGTASAAAIGKVYSERERERESDWEKNLYQTLCREMWLSNKHYVRAECLPHTRFARGALYNNKTIEHSLRPA